MKFLQKVAIAAALLTPIFPLWASAAAPAGYQSCVACHGASGEGNLALKAPALAGQGAAYLERQLRNFKAGLRGTEPQDTLGNQMRGMAATIADEDIEGLAVYLAALPSPVPDGPTQGDLKNGNNYYQSKCGACHGGKAQGNTALNAPALALLDAAYLQRQYLNFQQGLRGTHPDDRYGRQMKMMSTSLPGDKDLADVIAFIQSLAGGE